ncbi:MAG TPA: S41 family peptidase [Candidatus Brocadiia bacterium]|nr:S41 family peptidase [Candidatus Brocadiia bacterium]
MKKILSIACISIVLSFCGSIYAQAPQPAEDTSKGDIRREFYEPLAEFVKMIEENYVEPVDRAKLLQGAYVGMLSTLDDFSQYIPAEAKEEFEGDTKGQFGGLGIQISFKPVEKVIRVEQPIPGTPAFQMGVLAGDIIVRIKEEATGKVHEVKEFTGVHDAVRVLRGTPDTKVTITVFHQNSAVPEEITITRAIIKIDSVKHVMMVDENAKIGYIFVAHFHQKTVEDLTEAVKQLRAQGMKGLILDLRFNPGGLLSTAVRMADKFIDKGVVVSTKGRFVREEAYQASPDDDFDKIPLVVLVNRYSASASEIVAGAIKDHRRGILLGENTFGKGSVQTIKNLEKDPGTVKLTTAYYYTPSGICIHRKDGVGGIKPDIEVPLSPDQMRFLIVELSSATRQPKKEEKSETPKAPDENLAPLPDETLPPAAPTPAAPGAPGTDTKAPPAQPELRDVQLDRAVDVLRGMLWEKGEGGSTISEQAAKAK